MLKDFFYVMQMVFPYSSHKLCHYKNLWRQVYSCINFIVDSRKIYFSIPYFGRQSEEFKTKLLILLSKYFKNVDFNIVLDNRFKDGYFFNNDIGFQR